MAATNRTLTLSSTGGLANRLRVLLSGMVIAELDRRQFTMLWPRWPTCGALFHEMFDNQWNVVPADAESVARRPHRGGLSSRALPEVLGSSETHLDLRVSDWLFPCGQILPPSRTERWMGLLRRTRWWNDRARSTGGDAMGMATRLFLELKPRPGIRAAADAFCHHHFAPRMIGVHLRRGDMVGARPSATANGSATFAQVDRWVAEYPDARILLCTDDGAPDPKGRRVAPFADLKGRFRRRYGDRVVWNEPRSLDRASPTAIEDALVDLLLLRRTDPFVGSMLSSFSELAVLGRQVEAISASGSLLTAVTGEACRRLTRR